MSADLVRQLSALGLNLEQVAGVMDIIDAQTESRREKGRERWHKWKEKKGANVSQRLQTDTNVGSPLTRVEDSSSSKKDISGEVRKEDRAPAAPTPRAELERVLDSEHAAAVIDHRQRLRKPLSPHAAKLLAAKFAAFPDANAAADKMIEAGWSKIEPHWGQDRPNSTAPPNKGGSPKTFDEGGTGPRGQTKFLQQFEAMKKSQAMQS